MLNYSAATSFILKIAVFNLRGIVFVGRKKKKTTRKKPTKTLGPERLFQQQEFVNNLHGQISASTYKIHIPSTEY